MSIHAVRHGFRFGRFELDVRARELRKDGARLRLQDQPFEVLALLLEHAGEVVTRHELRARLWPQGTFVDFEHGLNAAVKRLRSALGDAADRPRFVETLNRLGYRFVASVERISGTEESAREGSGVSELWKKGATTRHSGARQAFVKGAYHWNKSGPDGLVEAIGFFEQAVALDPQFASAHSALGRALVAAADYYVRDPHATLEAARSAALCALRLDPDDDEAHLTLAEVRKSVDRDWARAEAGYHSALERNPRNDGAHRLYGAFLASQGRLPEAFALAQKARDLEPLCLVVNTSAAWVRYLAHDYNTAIEICRHTLDMDDRFVPAHRVIAAAWLQRGRLDEAVAELELAAGVRSDPVSSAWLAHALGTAGHVARAREIVRILEGWNPPRYVSAYHLALARVGIGDIDGSLASLNVALAACDPALFCVEIEPRFEPLHVDSRFTAFVKQLGLPHGSRQVRRAQA
jgi:DNA-binding winged helix-turn-helix (wHTH) protein/Tfp pilus assembly protein PilF